MKIKKEMEQRTLTIEKKERYTIIKLQRGKVNAIEMEMVTELHDVFTLLEADEEVEGVILTGIPHFFSAGLDVIALYEYDKEGIRAFFTAFGALYLKMAFFTKPLICALTGHAPAGGCVFALTADYRIMAKGEKYTIGLNEVAVNIQISGNLIAAYAFWIGAGNAHRYILEGKLLKGEEALSCGLVDELVPLEGVLFAAEKKMQHYLTADKVIFKNTKKKLRSSWFARMEKDPQKDLGEAIALWWSPRIRAQMKAFVGRLQKK